MRAARRVLLRQEMAIWLLMVIALSCLPWALRREAPDAAFTLLFPAILIGSTGAFMLHGGWLSRTHAAAVFAAAGALTVFIRIGQITEALEAGLLETLRLALVLVWPSPEPAARLAALAGWMGTLQQAWAQTADFAQRLGAWLAGLLRGQTVDDPASRAVFLALGLWLLALWAGRRLRLHSDPLGALLPATAVLAITLVRTVQDRWPLWLHLAALLILLGTTHVVRLLRRWQAARTDYSDSIAEDSLLSGGVLILLVLSTAFAVSTFSLHDFLDRFRRVEPATTTAAGAPVSRRSGSGSAPAHGTAGLQGAHLITAGPVLSEDVVMYVRTGDLPPMPATVPLSPPHYYWRGQTYQRYNGHAWSNQNRTDVRLEPSTSIVAASPVTYRTVHATVEVPRGVSGLAYWTGTLVSADMPLDVAWHLGNGSNPAEAAANTPANVDLIGAVAVEQASAGFDRYRFAALLPQASEEQLRAAPPVYPDWVSRQYLVLPDAVPERVRALARDITARGRTPYDRAVAIERYLRLIPYSLDVPAPPSSRDAADYFLFDLKRGYCDYYATTMTVMARAAGLPARLVTGYASGGYDPYTAQFVVREADAHAWTEIYFPGIGWIEFEPTAGQPLPGRESARTAPEPRAAQPRARTWAVLPAVDVRLIMRAWLLVPLAAALFACWLIVDALRLRSMDPNRAVGMLYRRLQHRTLRLAGDQFAGQTARERAALVEARLEALAQSGPAGRVLIAPAIASIQALTHLQMLNLFGPAPLRAEQGREALAQWSALRWRLVLLPLVMTLTRAMRRSAPSAARGPAAG